MKVRARNILGSVAIGALACSAMVATPAFAESGRLDTGNSDWTNRVQGVDRFATAIAASKAFDTVRAGSDTVVVANYLAWADVLAATPLAAELNANVLYSYAGNLDSRTKAEIVRLATKGVNNVLFVGGDGVVTNALMDEVAGLKDKDGRALELNVDRIGGADRYETAKLLAAETVSEYSDSAALANARAALKQNIADRTAVAKANAAVRAAQTELTKATQAYLDATAAVLATNNQINALQATLKPGGNLTQAELDEFKAQVKVRQDAVDAAYAALKAALAGGDDAAILGAQEDLAEAQAALKLTQDQYQQAASDVAANASILRDIEALNKKLGDATKGQIKAQNDAAAAYAAADTKLQEAVAYAAGPAAAAQADALEKANAVQKDYDDAVKAALAAGTDHPAFLATGMNFADALSAGPAAAQEQGVVLLTRDGSVPADTQAYLDSEPETFAVGGWAAAAVKADHSFVGADRYETAAKVAAEYQADGGQIALTSGLVSADAVVAGAAISAVDGAVVLTDPKVLSSATSKFFSFEYNGSEVVVFGGSGAVSNGVVSSLKTAING